MRFLIEHLWWILGILSVVVVGGGVLMFYTGWYQRVMDWFKPQSDRYVKVKMFCEDRQIRDRKAKVGRYVISDMKKHRSFYLVHRLLLSSPLGKGNFLALTERNARPIDFHKRLTEDDWRKFPTGQRVFIDTTADIRSESAKEASSNFMAQALSIMALCATLIVVIFGIIVFVQMRTAGVS